MHFDVLLKKISIVVFISPTSSHYTVLFMSCLFHYQVDRQMIADVDVISTCGVNMFHISENQIYYWFTFLTNSSGWHYSLGNQKFTLNGKTHVLHGLTYYMTWWGDNISLTHVSLCQNARSPHATTLTMIGTAKDKCYLIVWVHAWHADGPRPLNLTWRHGHFLKSTCNMEPSDMRNKIRDTTWGRFLKSIRDMWLGE